VAGGNVETSQRIVDVLFGALARALPDRIPAASQGTMNNVACGGVWRGEAWAYYETVGGGAGAARGTPGASAVQTHMTNTLNPPVEALEHAIPVRITEYRVRRGSGGAGRWRGGDGLVRGYRFLAPVELSLLAERRTHTPWGRDGGAPGAPGEDVLVRAGGAATPLPGKVTLAVDPGDELRIATPGGGGFGPADEA
jgi:N-methylhydantoinase B